MNDKLQRIARDRANADQGDFFFAKARMSNGNVIPRPVFIIGKNGGSNDSEDVIVCSCTKQPARSNYDIPVQLKEETCVRTNKIYTVRRAQLEFKIGHQITPQTISEILNSCVLAINT